MALALQVGALVLVELSLELPPDAMRFHPAQAGRFPTQEHAAALLCSRAWVRGGCPLHSRLSLSLLSLLRRWREQQRASAPHRPLERALVSSTHHPLVDGWRGGWARGTQGHAPRRAPQVLKHMQWRCRADGDEVTPTPTLPTTYQDTSTASTHLVLTLVLMAELVMELGLS